MESVLIVVLIQAAIFGPLCAMKYLSTNTGNRTDVQR